MDPKHLTIVFYGLVVIGILLLLVLLYRIIFKEDEIDKSSATWLVIAFVCIALPVVGNLTIEYGEFRISLTKLSSDAKEVSEVINILTEENSMLKQQVEHLNAQISESRATLLSEDTPAARKTRVLNQFQEELQMISDQSINVERKLESATIKNDALVQDLEHRSKKR
ncbi:MAG: hypothetical protein ABFS10_12800 [Bacteroidota bacterium]